MLKEERGKGRVTMEGVEKGCVFNNLIEESVSHRKNKALLLVANYCSNLASVGSIIA